jgi:hypothetical protein
VKSPNQFTALGWWLKPRMQGEGQAGAGRLGKDGVGWALVLVFFFGCVFSVRYGQWNGPRLDPPSSARLLFLHSGRAGPVAQGESSRQSLFLSQHTAHLIAHLNRNIDSSAPDSEASMSEST